jgi:hypothetical protein
MSVHENHDQELKNEDRKLNINQSLKILEFMPGNLD